MFHLHGTRLPEGRTEGLPDLRESHGGLQPHHRLLPLGAELERRQEPGISGQKDISGRRCAGDIPKREEQEPVEKKKEKYYLYTTATCPNCRIIKPILKKAGIPFEEWNLEQHIQETTARGLTQAPTLVVQGDSPAVYGGVTKIEEFLKQIAR